MKLLGVLFALPLAAAPDLATLLKGVESRYNSPRTMQLAIEQTIAGQGSLDRTESGTLYLQKPGRMRWHYTVPEGKVFLADGKHVWFYSPNAGRVERSPVKESGDLRTPLAFLIGRLDFHRDFKEFRTRPEGADLHIAAKPKSDRAPYSTVEFLVTPDFRIRLLKVIGQDRSVMTFRLSDEKINPRIDPRMFQFEAPPGVEVIDVSVPE